jgi:hypothetical protein
VLSGGVLIRVSLRNLRVSVASVVNFFLAIFATEAQRTEVAQRKIEIRTPRVIGAN